MKVTNAIKKLTKAGFTVTNYGPTYTAKRELGKDIVSFFRNGGSDEVVCINVRHQDDHHDLMIDYSAGCFVDNITQAIAIAR